MIEQIGDVPRDFSAPTASVVIACCSEGPDLEGTFRHLCEADERPDEIILVDDGSPEPLEPRVAPFGDRVNLRVIRNDRRTGSGRAKTLGLDAATGDLLTVMDSHLRPPRDWLTRTKAAFVRWPYSAFCPLSFSFRTPPRFCGRGCRFLLHKHGTWDSAWNPKPPAEFPNGHVIGSLMGGCYSFGRGLMHYLGGYAREHVRWGFEQDQFSLRVWSAGFDCRLLDFPMPHHYSSDGHPQAWLKVNDSKAEHWGLWANRIRSAATLWQDERLFREVYFPLMRRHYWPAGLSAWWKSAGSLIAADRERIARLRRRTDDEMATTLLGFPHPRSIAEYQALEKKHGRPPKQAKVAKAAI